MLRLLLPIYAMLGTTLAGIGVIVVLTMGIDTMQTVAIAAIAGFILGLPVSWMVTKKLIG